MVLFPSKIMNEWQENKWIKCNLALRLQIIGFKLYEKNIEGLKKTSRYQIFRLTQNQSIFQYFETYKEGSLRRLSPRPSCIGSLDDIAGFHTTRSLALGSLKCVEIVIICPYIVTNVSWRHTHEVVTFPLHLKSILRNRNVFLNHRVLWGEWNEG